MKIVIGNYPKQTDSRNLILNSEVKHYDTGEELSPLFAFITNIEGLETPPYRNGTGDWSGADGGYLSSQLYSARTITISGSYIDKKATCDHSSDTMDQFDHMARLFIRSRLPIRTKQYMRIFLDNGLTFYTEGYCIDLKMDYNYVGHGDYQITFYCPDPALYRGDADGSIGSEWNIATLNKENKVGYENPATMTNQHWIEWSTGGRSTPVAYAGDMPYSPQIIVAPKNGEHITNPQFYSINEKKVFGLGYPETSVAQLTVTSVDANHAVTGVTITEGGAYDSDYSATGILMQNYTANTGAGCKVTLEATRNENGTFTFTSANIVDGGSDYNIGDVLTPYIAGAAIFSMSGGQTLVIDMLEHTVMLDGSSRSYYITPGSEWFQLDPLQTNSIIFTSASHSDAQTANVRWRNGYQGI